MLGSGSGSAREAACQDEILPELERLPRPPANVALSLQVCRRRSQSAMTMQLAVIATAAIGGHPQRSTERLYTRLAVA
jgi:hypothetical protein